MVSKKVATTGKYPSKSPSDCKYVQVVDDLMQVTEIASFSHQKVLLKLSDLDRIPQIFYCLQEKSWQNKWVWHPSIR